MKPDKKRKIRQPDPVKQLTFREILLKNKYQALVIFFLCLLFYSVSIRNGYTLDDVGVVTENRFTKQGIEGIFNLVTHSHFYGHNGLISGLYRPVPLVTHAVEYSLFGPNPQAGHAVNVILYALLCVSLYLLLVRWLKTAHPVIPFIAMLVFLSLPVHTEVVASIKGRDDLLTFLFLSFAMISSIIFIDKRSWFHYALCMIFFIIALFSKESAIPFLVLIPVGLYFFGGAQLRGLLLVFSGLLGAVVCYLLIRAQYIDAVPPMHLFDPAFPYAGSRADKMATAVATLLDYFRLLVFPFPLLWDYTYNQIPVISWGHLKPAVSLMVVTGVLVFAGITFRRKSIYSFSILFFFISLSITANMIIPTEAIFAERFLFIPSFAFAMVLAVIIGMLFRIEPGYSFYLAEWTRRKRLFLTGLVILLTLVPGIYSYARSRIWHDNLTLFVHDIPYQPNNSRAHYYLGIEYGRVFLDSTRTDRPEYLDKALVMLKRANEIEPTLFGSCFLSGILNFTAGRYPDAIAGFEQAFRADPEAPMPGYSPENALYYIGLSYQRMAKYPEALEAYQRLLDFHPKTRPRFEHTFLWVFNNVGALYMMQGLPDKAIPYLEQAVKLDSNSTTALQNLGYLYMEGGRYDEAIRLYTRLLKLQPGNVQVQEDLNTCHTKMDKQTADRN